MHCSILMPCLWGLLLALTNLVASKGANNIEDRQAIITAYHNEDVAANHKSAANSLTDFSHLWYAYMPNGEIFTYHMLEESLRLTFPYQKSINHHDKILSLVVKGDKAKAHVRGGDTQVLVNPQTRQTLTIETNIDEIDYWQRHNSRWLHSWSKILSSQVTRNGAVVDKEP